MTTLLLLDEAGWLVPGRAQILKGGGWAHYLDIADHCGYKVAIQIVVASLALGWYSNFHKYWDSYYWARG